ncbi:PSP1 C-terminal conserved region-domain-containing protein [Parasitella parasitica]|nr:PSP1 C-terminal conserved region-domain-containing protein [Parasitella parasitica]
MSIIIQEMTLQSEWKGNEDEAIEMVRDGFDEEPDWKVVGSRSRRESFSVGRVVDGATSNNNHATASLPQTPSLINQKQQPEFKRRGSENSEKQWGSFGGFQWEGPSIFDEDIMPTAKPPLFPSSPDQYYDPTAVLTTPMLPTVPSKPIYRQQRSFSFSMGQDSTFFGYDDYNTRNTSSFLTPTLEEEEENDQLPSFDDAYLRSRSQSSNAAFGIYPAGRWMNMNRRASLGFINSPSSTSSSSLNDNSKDLLSQRRMSQPLNQIAEYSFPEIIPNGGPTHSGNQTTSIRQLSDYLENSHIHRSTSSYILQNQPSHIIPETSSSATVIPSQRQQQQQQQTQDTVNAGKGLLLQKLPPHISLFMIEFKSGRTDFYYVSEPSLKLRVGDLVLVEADRGKDLGKVATDVLTVDQVLLLQQQQQQNNSNRLIIDQDQTDEKKASATDSHVKRVYKIAEADEVCLLLNKEQDEQKALAVCLQKIKNRKLSMEVVDAEFQWDRRKLTFYFIAERRIDFRELVRELFKIYKTRIWMCAVNPTRSSFST